MMSWPLLLCMLGETKGSLPPAADAHNRVAMAHYDAGRLEAALVEFRAGYDAMPDLRRDRERRDMLLDSMHFTLMDLHQRDGSPEPLCRIVPLLEQHVAGLTATFPDRPEFGEIKFARARQRVKDRLAAFPPDVCAPRETTPAPQAGAALKVEPLSPAVAPAAATPVTPMLIAKQPRQAAPGRASLVAGGLVLPLGLVALGVLGGVASAYREDLAEADALNAVLVTRRWTEDEHTRMRGLATTTRSQERSMLALGLVGGALISTGVALLVRGASQRSRARLNVDVASTRIGLVLMGEF